MALFNAPVSAMDSFQTMMSTIGNNISNVDTTGYKTSEVNFSDLLSQTISGGSAGNTSGLGGTNPLQVGMGVRVAQISPIMTEGSLSQTGNPTNVAISGDGFFQVSPSPSGTPVYYTRAGNFSLDSNGNIVDPNGNYLLGTDSNGAVGPISVLVTNTDPTSGQTVTTQGQFAIGADGTVTITGGTPVGNQPYTIQLADFADPQGLVKTGNNLYSASAASGTAQTFQPGTNTQLQQGYLEGSNVDLNTELTNMIVAQTGYSSSSKVISTENQMMQTLMQNV